MADEQKKELAIAVHCRPLEEIEWFLQSMLSFSVKEIASDAGRALQEWTLGNRKPAQEVLTRWYQTLRQDTNHTLNEGCAEPLDMHEVLMSKDKKRHMDLLIQMIVTLARQ